MDRHGVRPHVRFESEVLGARWDDESSTWSVHVRAADGTEETLVARAVISGVGQLNRAKLPDIPGRIIVQIARAPLMNKNHTVSGVFIGIIPTK